MPTKNGTALALRHVMFEDAGLISRVLQERGVKLDYVDVPSSDLTQVDALSSALLVILGGPIGVYEDEDYPWLNLETALIRARLATRRPTLGIFWAPSLWPGPWVLACIPVQPRKSVGRR